MPHNAGLKLFVLRWWGYNQNVSSDIYIKFIFMLTFLSVRVLVFSHVGLIYMLNASPTAFDFDVYQPCNPRQAPITAASKIFLNSWRLSGTSVISADLAFGDIMWWMSFSATWIAGIYILGLHALNVKIVVMNICWRFLVKEDIFAHHAIRNGSWNSVNGYVQKC